MPADDNDMMSGLIDMDSMMGLYGAGNSDDLGDWGEVTNEDFSFFDKVNFSGICALYGLSFFFSLLKFRIAFFFTAT